jgi:hypothetical protein
VVVAELLGGRHASTITSRPVGRRHHPTLPRVGRA